MSLMNLFRRRGSAPVARERLQILLSHERSSRGQSDLLAILRDEILAVVAKHVNVERDQVRVTMDRGDNVSMLEIDVEVPHAAGSWPLSDRRSPSSRASGAGRSGSVQPLTGGRPPADPSPALSEKIIGPTVR